MRVGWKRLGAAQRGTVEAKLQVHNGVFHVPQLGQELHEAELSIETEPEHQILRAARPSCPGWCSPASAPKAPAA